MLLAHNSYKANDDRDGHGGIGFDWYNSGLPLGCRAALMALPPDWYENIPGVAPISATGSLDRDWPGVNTAIMRQFVSCDDSAPQHRGNLGPSPDRTTSVRLGDRTRMYASKLDTLFWKDSVRCDITEFLSRYEI